MVQWATNEAVLRVRGHKPYGTVHPTPNGAESEVFRRRLGQRDAWIGEDGGVYTFNQLFFQYIPETPTILERECNAPQLLDRRGLYAQSQHGVIDIGTPATMWRCPALS